MSRTSPRECIVGLVVGSLTSGCVSVEPITTAQAPRAGSMAFGADLYEGGASRSLTGEVDVATGHAAMNTPREGAPADALWEVYDGRRLRHCEAGEKRHRCTDARFEQGEAPEASPVIIDPVNLGAVLTLELEGRTAEGRYVVRYQSGDQYLGEITAPTNRAHGIWVRQVSDTARLWYCHVTADRLPICRSAPLMVDLGVIRITFLNVLGVHHLETEDVIWLNQGTISRCAASPENPVPTCELARETQ